MGKNIVKLDEWDKKLFYELDKNAHAPISKLAKKIRKSKQFVDFRIKRLEKNKVIIAYHAIVDASKLSFTTYRIYFKFQRFLEEDEKKFIEYLKSFENVWTIAKLYGKWDYAFFLGIKTIKEFHYIWNSIMLKFKEKTKNYNVSIYAPIINFNKVFFTERDVETIERIYGGGSEEKHDTLDIKILKEYAMNVRKPLIEISSKLKISLNTVIDRIKKMEKRKIIVGYKLDLNQESLGYEGFRLDINLNSTKRNKELLEFCRINKNIYQVEQSIGHSDFEMSVIVKNHYELLRLMNVIKKQFSDVVNDFEYFNFSIFPKLSFVPD